MRITILSVMALLLYWCAGGAQAQAQTQVELLDTFPAGHEIVLPPNQSIYLRIAYRADAPVRIWATPYFQGEPVDAGTSGSLMHAGKGEMLAFFFLPKGGQVDEIRVAAGSGNPDRTPEIARWPLRVYSYNGAAPPPPEPAWVATMREADKQARDAAFQAQMSQPVSAGDMALLTALMWLVLGLGVLGIAWPAWALWKWRGGWRRWALLPMAAIGLVVLNILFGVMLDPTSHNLWPFEIVMAGGFSLVAMLVLAVARRIWGAKPG